MSWRQRDDQVAAAMVWPTPDSCWASSAALADVAQALDLLGSAEHTLRAKLLYLQADLHFANAAPQPAEVAVRAALATAERTGDQETLAKASRSWVKFTATAVIGRRSSRSSKRLGHHPRRAAAGEARTETDLAFLRANG
ncbi:MAG: hypothetical protein R3A10_05485 [Caldilineaceae bacterium]